MNADNNSTNNVGPSEVTDLKAEKENKNLQEMSLLEQALYWAEQGFFVHPVTKDKKPVTPQWQHAASRDPETITELFAGKNKASFYVGGQCKDFVAVDIDSPKRKERGEGFDPYWQKLLSENTRVHQTQSGGFHVFFDAPQNNISNSDGYLPNDTEVRGSGGYVVLPDGETYTVRRSSRPAKQPDHLSQKLVFRRDSDGRGVLTGHAKEALRRAVDDRRGNHFTNLFNKVFYDINAPEGADKKVSAWHEAVRDIDRLFAAKGMERELRCRMWLDAASRLSVTAPDQNRRERFARVSWNREIEDLVLGADALEKKERGAGFVNLTDFLKDDSRTQPVIWPMLERGYLYCFTGPKGNHKTGVAVAMALAVSTGGEFAPGMKVYNKSRVLFMAGENPTDVKKRFQAIQHHLGMHSAELADIDIFPRSIDISKDVDTVLELAEGREYGLVIVDTLQAYGPSESGSEPNTPAKNYALALRRLTELGNPAVVVMAHPTKADASDSNKGRELEPYGGGAFANEVDALATVWTLKGGVRIKANQKYRGGFSPVHFDPVLVEDCPALLTKITDDNGEVHTIQQKAPVLVPKQVPTDGDHEDEASAPLSGLTQNQRRVFMGLIYYQMQCGLWPDRDKLVGHMLRYWLGKSPEKVKKTRIRNTIEQLHKKDLVTLNGELVEPAIRNAKRHYDPAWKE
jgi:hypothetical protein